MYFWRDLLTSMAVVSNPEYREEQLVHSRLLVNMTVQSVQQIRWWPEWNLENKTVKATHPNYLIPDSIQLKATKCCIYIFYYLCLYTVYTSRSWAVLVLLVLVTLPACSCKPLHCGALVCIVTQLRHQHDFCNRWTESIGRPAKSNVACYSTEEPAHMCFDYTCMYTLHVATHSSGDEWVDEPSDELVHQI